MSKEKKPGDSIVITISCQQGLVDDIDKKIVDYIRDKTGMKFKRSNLMQLLMQIALETEGKLDLSNTYDNAGVEAALKAAFKKLD